MTPGPPMDQLSMDITKLTPLRLTLSKSQPVLPIFHSHHCSSKIAFKHFLFNYGTLARNTSNQWMEKAFWEQWIEWRASLDCIEYLMIGLPCLSQVAVFYSDFEGDFKCRLFHLFPVTDWVSEAQIKRRLLFWQRAIFSINLLKLELRKLSSALTIPSVYKRVRYHSQLLFHQSLAGILLDVHQAAALQPILWQRLRCLFTQLLDWNIVPRQFDRLNMHKCYLWTDKQLLGWACLPIDRLPAL